MDTIFIVTEANEIVATGHLMESIVCANTLSEAGYEVSFWVNNNADQSLKKRIPCQFQEYLESIEKDYNRLTKSVSRINPKAIIFNLREITERFLNRIQTDIEQNTKIVCIDEFGHRNLSADIIINPMIAPYYWEYGDSKAQSFCGAQYLVLPEKLEELHQKEKKVNQEIHRIVVSMGGADPKNYTLDLVECMPQRFPDAAIEIIVGGGNRNRKEIEKRAVRYKNLVIRENISNLPDLIYGADLLVCAGGNTLHESACIGTPAIVVPSMPHEERTAKCFEEKGFGLAVDIKNDWKKSVLALCDKIEDYALRSQMCVKGKKISDGCGRKRILEIINRI